MCCCTRGSPFQREVVRQMKAEPSAIVYTMVETAKANGLDSFDYLSLLLDEIRYLGKIPPNALLESLLPWSAQIQKIVKHLE